MLPEACHKRFLLLAFCHLLISSCGLSSGTDADLIRASYSAIKEENWESFKENAVTTADFDLKKLKIRPLQESQSFTGSVLKKEQQKRLKAAFDSACTGGQGLIDFKKSNLAGSKMLASYETKSLSGQTLPIRLYAFETGKDSRLSPPYLALTTWKESPKVLALLFELPVGVENSPQAK